MNSSFWKSKKVLITGHTGFKGSWLSLWLNEMGADVLGVSLAPTTKPNLFELAELGKRFRSVICDIRDQQKLRAVYDEFKPEIVLHLAAQALVRPSYKDPVGTYSTNVMGTVHVLESARLTPSVRTIVNVTTDKCYENREWAWGYRENEAMGGFDPYSSSKGCSELVTSAYRRSFFSGTGTAHVGLASARAGNVIGGGDWSEDRLIPDCMRALLKGEAIPIRNPDSIRPWQHVLEPLSGYLCLAQRCYEKPDAFSEAFNFGPEDSEVKPVGWIADRITRIWGKGASWKNVKEANAPHEAHYLKLDISLAKSKLGWRPRLSIEQNLDWTTNWYRRFGQGESALKITLEQIKEFENQPKLSSAQ